VSLVGERYAEILGQFAVRTGREDDEVGLVAACLGLDGKAVTGFADASHFLVLATVDTEVVDLLSSRRHELAAADRADAEVVEQVGLVHPRPVGVEHRRLEAVLRGEEGRTQSGGAAADNDHCRIVRSRLIAHRSYIVLLQRYQSPATPKPPRNTSVSVVSFHGSYVGTVP